MADQPLALQVRGLTRHFGGVAAIDSLDLEVRRGEALAVIGPNGAGKSTLVNLISGALRPSAGRIELSGQSIESLSPDQRTRLGIGRTHQIPRPFARMTVRENLALAARHARHPPHARDLTAHCDALLERTGLIDVAGQPAGGLPLLRRKRLELARALALQPRLLLLDEIGAGLIESETRSLIELIQSLRPEVESLLIIEHVMEVITACCERTTVLASGKLLTTGETREVLRDPQVVSVYLGSGHESAAAPSASGHRPAGQAQPLLAVRGLKVHFGGVRALRGIDLAIHRGEAVALLGANGAGKSTLARAISGVAPWAGGSVEFDGRSLSRVAPEQIAARGIGHCMEGRRIFSSLSVQENLLLALPAHAGPERQRQRLQAIYELFPVLHERRGHPGTAMSGGQQQMLAIGRALMNEPQLVLFDEISLGLAPIAVEKLYESLARIRDSGVAMLVVEQNIERGLQLADRAYVLAHGEIHLEGTPQEIRNAPQLRALYVGESSAA